MISRYSARSILCLPSAVGVFLFSFLCVLGSSLFALGSHFKGTPYLLPLMLTGRLLFGSGNGSLTSKATALQPFTVQLKTCVLKLLTHLPLVSCPEPNHCILVQREGAGFGLWTDSGLFPPGLRPQLLPHAKVWRELWHAVDTVGR